MVVQYLQGDCREVLKGLPAGSVQCVVTSPPYYGLRAYLPDGHPDKAREIGTEPSPDEYVAQMVCVFREVRRVLRDDGTVWLNLGDSYAAGQSASRGSPDRSTLTGGGGRYREGSKIEKAFVEQAPRKRDSNGAGVKQKDMIGIPWMVAFALRTDGWYLRSDIIWHKPNPMPESVTDRPTSAHEHVFLLTKRASYYYDANAIAEATEYPGDNRALRTDTRKVFDPMCADNGSRARTGNPTGTTRNAHNVWTITSKPFPGSHFATMPPDLVERCIKAGTSERGCCSTCGSPYTRIIEKGEPDLDHQRACGGDLFGAYTGQSTKGHTAAGVQDASAVKARILAGMRVKKTTGWAPTCHCPQATTTSCTVLDPFSGAGTTLMVANALQRSAIGIELNPEYVEMSRQRIEDKAGLLGSFAWGLDE